MSETTNQVSKTPPELRNPTGKGGFGDNPENRSAGGWKKENVVSYQFKRFINMSQQEFADFSKTPKSVMTMAERLAYNRVLAADKSLPDLREILDRTEGKAAQSIDMTSAGEALQPVLVRFIGAEDGNTDTN